MTDSPNPQSPIPDPQDDRIESGRLLFAGPAAFERGVVDMAQLPDAELPEVAFAGRSNVGKSSLIPLTRRNKLARASTSRTRAGSASSAWATGCVWWTCGLRLRQGVQVGDRALTALTRDYLRGRPAKRVILLIDARHA